MREFPEWVSIGYINGAHGIKGELKVIPLTERPRRFELLQTLHLSSNATAPSPFEIEGVRFALNSILLKLKGVDTRTQAEQLKGFEILIPGSACVKLPEDEYYHFELIGLTVKSTTGENIGTITNILEMPANDIYVVKNLDREILIPAVKEFVKKIDLEEGIMVIQVLDGLIE